MANDKGIAHKIEKGIAKVNEKAGKKLRIITEVALFIFIVCMYSFIFYAVHHSTEDNLINNRRAKTYNEGWTLTYGDGTTEEITLPYVTEKQPANDVLTLTNTLPTDIESHDYISFRAVHQDVKVYIDGELRRDFYQTDDFIYKDDIASRYLTVELNEADAGKPISIEFVLYQDVTRSFSEVYYGNQFGIITQFMLAESFSFVMAIIILNVCVLICFIGGAIRINSKNDIQLDHAGWLLTFIGAWNLTQSDFRDVLFGNIKGISIVPFILIYLICITAAMYFNSVSEKRYSALFSLYELVVSIFLIIATLQQHLEIKEMREHMVEAFVFLYIFVALFIMVVVLDIKNGKIKHYASIAIGYVFLAIMGVAQYIQIMLNTSRPNGTFVMVGGLVLMILAFYHSMSVFMTMDADKKAALQIADSKSQFLAKMSHEIRTPINAVLGMNEAILRESDDKTILGYAQDVNQAGHLLLSLINDILDFSKLDSGKMDLVESDYNLRSLIMGCYNMIEKRAQDKNLEFVVDVDENLPLMLHGDEVRIQQIMTNLLTNAVKYTQQGKIGLKVFQNIENGEQWLRFYVSDTGMGIRPEDKDKLFSAFQRVDEQKNKHIEGTGLGLAICSQLVKLMGGRIEIESTYGSGSVFMVHIPQKAVGDEKIGKFSLDVHVVGDRKRDTSDVFKAPKARILVVDDIQVNLRVAVSLLRRTEMTIDTAISGDDAIKLVQENLYDVILLDHMMPDKDGIQTLQEMKKLKTNINKHTPVIMLTANAVAGAKDQYMDVGFTDYLSKPFSAKEVQNMLLKYIPEEKIETDGTEEEKKEDKPEENK